MATRAGVLLTIKALRAAPLRLPEGVVLEDMIGLWVAETTRCHVDDGALAAATERYIQSRAAFWPPIGELLGLALATGRGPRDEPEVAWSELLAAFARHGRDNPPRLLGWKPPKPLRVWDRFKKAYRDVVHDPPSREPWFLDEDPHRRMAIETGLAAAGGWEALDDLNNRAANRAAFREAFRAVRGHGLDQLEYENARLTSTGVPLRRVVQRDDADHEASTRLLRELGNREVARRSGRDPEGA